MRLRPGRPGREGREAHGLAHPRHLRIEEAAVDRVGVDEEGGLALREDRHSLFEAHVGGPGRSRAGQQAAVVLVRRDGLGAADPGLPVHDEVPAVRVEEARPLGDRATALPSSDVPVEAVLPPGQLPRALHQRLQGARRPAQIRHQVLAVVEGGALGHHRDAQHLSGRDRRLARGVLEVVPGEPVVRDPVAEIGEPAVVAEQQLLLERADHHHVHVRTRRVELDVVAARELVGREQRHRDPPPDVLLELRDPALHGLGPDMVDRHDPQRRVGRGLAAPARTGAQRARPGRRRDPRGEPAEGAPAQELAARGHPRPRFSAYVSRAGPIGKPDWSDLVQLVGPVGLRGTVTAGKPPRPDPEAKIPRTGRTNSAPGR